MLYVPFPFKRCSTCGAYLLPTLAHFNRNRTTPDGLQYRCIQCRKAHYQDMRENVLQHVRQYKTDNRETVLANKRKTWHKHKERINAENRAKYAANPERWKAYNRTNHQKHREKHVIECRRYYAANRDKALADTTRYHHEHPEVARISGQRYRSKKRGLPHDFTPQDWRNCLDWFGHSCAYCGQPEGLFRFNKLTAEHFIAISDPACPGTIPENIVPACYSCNSSKNNKPPLEWLENRFGKRKAKQIAKRIAEYCQYLQDKRSGH